MFTQIVEINPTQAKIFLEKNTSNRPVSITSVMSYANDMKDGNWRLTHQGLLLGKNDIVIDGQHRLMAIVASGTTQKLLLTRDESIESPLDLPVDTGNKRHVSFINNVTPRLAGVANYARHLHTGVSKSTPAALKPYCKIYEHPLDQMISGYSPVKFISNASVFLAGCTKILTGTDPNYVRSCYRMMLVNDFANFPPIVSSFYKQLVIDRRAYTKSQLFARAIRVFDPANHDIKKFIIQNESKAFEEAKEIFDYSLTFLL